MWVRQKRTSNEQDFAADLKGPFASCGWTEPLVWGTFGTCFRGLVRYGDAYFGDPKGKVQVIDFFWADAAIAKITEGSGFAANDLLELEKR